ncbi:DMT family transporter [Clostridium sardiniense]|uniref:DMT family transporter n=1 Tax=Clostridium sardiniense TaxID=29369 RepID=UPI003D329684
MKNYKGILFAILASVAFGLMPIFAKFAYINGSNPNTVLFFRFAIASLVLLVYLLCKNVSIKVTKNQFLLLFITGLIGYTITTQTLFMSYNYLGVGLATTLHFIYPAFVCILEYIFFKKKMSRNKLLSLIFAGIGVYALIAFENNTLSALGLFLALFSGIAYGINIIMLAMKQIKDIDNRVITMYITFGAAVGMFIYSLIDGSLITRVTMNLGVAYILIAVVSTILSMILLLKGIEMIGASSTSILGTFEPIVSIIMGILLFREELTFALIIGTILILISTIILARDKSGDETIEEIIEEKNHNIGLEI